MYRRPASVASNAVYLQMWNTGSVLIYLELGNQEPKIGDNLDFGQVDIFCPKFLISYISYCFCFKDSFLSEL